LSPPPAITRARRSVRRGPAGVAGDTQPSGFAGQIPLDIRRDPLPPRLRPDREFGALDITEWFGETSGGVRRYVLEKSQYVAGRDWLSHVVVVPGPMTSVTDGVGSRCYRLRGPMIPTQTPYRWMYNAPGIKRIIDHERPDIIEVGSPWLAPWIANQIGRRAGIPLVWFFHGNFPRALSVRPEASPPMLALRRSVTAVAWRYVRRVSRLFELTMVSSDSTATDLRNAGVERVVRVPLGVDLDIFHPRRRGDIDSVRRTLGLPAAPRPVVAFMGRLVAEKELGVLIDAWREVERRTDATLLMVGAGPMEKEWRRSTEADRERLAALLAAVDCYVAPGSTETFGLAPLEALACGTPVVSADLGGVAEQVTRSGAGATFASGDAHDLARVVIEMLDGDPQTLGEIGRAYAAREHSWSAVFDQLFAVYRDLVGR
jgi:alpha-1,6-mannosyltransferase